jgi:hypothetical protein
VIGRCPRTFGREEVAAIERRQPHIEVTMATPREQNRIVETSTEARQGEPGPSVAALLAISTGLAILILAVVWFVFFRT